MLNNNNNHLIAWLCTSVMEILWPNLENLFFYLFYICNIFQYFQYSILHAL